MPERQAIRFAMVRPDAKPKAKATKAKATKAKAAFPQIVKAITDGKAKVGIKSPAGDRMITNVEELLNFALEMRDLAASQPKAEAAIVIEATL